MVNSYCIHCIWNHMCKALYLASQEFWLGQHITFTLWLLDGRADSVEKTLMLWKTDGKRGQKRAAEHEIIRQLHELNRTLIWANSPRQWRTGKPDVLQYTGLQRVKDRTQRLNKRKFCFTTNKNHQPFNFDSSTWKWKSFSSVPLFATPWTIQSVEFARPDYWSG